MMHRAQGHDSTDERVAVTRRGLLGIGVRLLAGLGGVGLLTACGGTTTTATTSSAAPAQAAASTVTVTQASVSTSVSVVTSVQTQTATATSVQTQTATVSVAPSGGKIILDFWNPAGDTNGKAIIGDQVDRFNKANPNLQVRDSIIDNGNNYEKYTAALAGGVPPDAIMTYDYDPLTGWANDNAIQTLDAYAAEEKIDQSDYFPIVWPMLSFSGHIWGFMQEFDSEVFAWNKGVFSANGLDPATPPKTIAELDDLNNKLTKHDPTGAISQLGIAPGITGIKGGSTDTWIAMFGGMFFDTLKGTFTITRPENAAALDWMASTWKKIGGRAAIDAYNKNVHGQDGLGNGKQGMGLVTEHIPYDWKTQYKNLDMQTALLPVNQGVFYGSGAAGGGNLFVVPKGVPHVKESITFLKYMGSGQQVLEWNVRENNLPAVKSVALSPDFAKQVPDMHAFLDMLKLSADQNHMTGPITHPAVNEFKTMRDKVVNDILDGKYPAAQGLQQLDQQFKPVLDKYKK